MSDKVKQEIELIGMKAELSASHCELNHGPRIDPHLFPAVEFLALPIDKKTPDYVDPVYLYIPICKDCADALMGDEWTLLYCLDCNSSQWIFRAKAKLGYRHHIIWLNGCPKCTKTFGGMHFADTKDFKNAPSEDL